jgi:hypothetical protein
MNAHVYRNSACGVLIWQVTFETNPQRVQRLFGENEYQNGPFLGVV